MNVELLFFLVVAIVAVLSAIAMITRPNPVMSVLFLIVNFFCLALLYLLLQAQFVAVIQILVYAGAIMVLFLFVIMLLNLGDEQHITEKLSGKKILAIVLASATFIEILLGVSVHACLPTSPSPVVASMGTVQGIGKILFTDYLVPFEATSILLLAAMVGVLVLAKKKFG